MFTIIFSLILAILVFVITGCVFGKDKYGDPEVVGWKINKKQFSAIIPLIIILFACYTIVPANNVGVRYNPFKNGTQEKTLKEGFYGKNPIEKIYTLSTKIQEFQFKDISIQTKDSQYVNSILQVQARIDKTKAFEYFKKYGDKDLEDIKSILSNTIQKQFEKVTTQYNVMEVLGDKRNEIVDKTLGFVKEELLKDGIMVERIVLVDTDAGKEIENAISKEAIAKKEVDTAKYQKEKAKLEGEAKVIEAQKEKEANALLSKTLTDEILLEKFIEKWNGELPKVSSGENIFDITSILESSKK